MKRIHRTAILIAIVVAMLRGDVAAACDCKAPPPPAEALANARTVFVGRVTAIAADGITLEASRGWKGVKSKEVVVANALKSCGFPFEVGKQYLVYTATAVPEGKKPALTVSLCSRTKHIGDAAEDLKSLGKPEWELEKE